MSRHIELLVCTATAAAVAGSAAAAVANDSLVVKNAEMARIINAWVDLQAAGAVQIVRPTGGHDTTRDQRIRVPASEVELAWQLGLAREVRPQDLLAVTLFEAATAGDVATASLLMEYDGMNGINQRLIDWDELKRRAINYTSIDASLTSAVGPLYVSSEELITAESDLLHGNTDYAVLGYRVSTECASVYMKGPDTGYRRVGGPGNDLDGDLTTNWFCMLSRAFNRAFIPVINTGNKSDTFIGCHQDENSAAVPVTWYLAELKR